MAFLASHRTFAVKSELDIFATKPTQNSIESGQYIELRPLSILDRNSPIEFFLAESDNYIDLSRTQLYLRVKITKEDGTALEAADAVSPINNFHGSLFEHVSVELNNKVITPPSNLYAYRCIIEKLLNYGTDASKSHLSSGLFTADDYSNMKNVGSSGFVERKSFMKDGVVELMDFLHTDICSQEKFLLNGVSVRVKLYRTKPSFALMTGNDDEANYKIDIEEAILLIRKVVVNPSIALAHQKVLGRANCKLNINRIELKSLTLAKDTQTKAISNIYLGKLKEKNNFET